MTHSRNFAPLHTWKSVRRWTLLGPIGCVLASISFNLWMLQDYADDVRLRVMISSIVLPVILGVPLFYYFSSKVRSLSIANARLGRVARTDSLTACLNRGAFTTKVSDWLRDPTHAPAGALLMIDADNFKAINDLYGHDQGDEALTLIARAIRAVLRNGDLVGRMGGEEFAVFLPGVNKKQTLQIADRIRRSVNLAVFMPDGEQRVLSVSIGGAVFENRTKFSELFRLADQYLYGAKNAGRNTSNIEEVMDEGAIDLRRIA